MSRRPLAAAHDPDPGATFQGRGGGERLTVRIRREADGSTGRAAGSARGPEKPQRPAQDERQEAPGLVEASGPRRCSSLAAPGLSGQLGNHGPVGTSERAGASESGERPGGPLFTASLPSYAVCLPTGVYPSAQSCGQLRGSRRGQRNDVSARLTPATQTRPPLVHEVATVDVDRLSGYAAGCVG